MTQHTTTKRVISSDDNISDEKAVYDQLDKQISKPSSKQSIEQQTLSEEQIALDKTFMQRAFELAQQAEQHNEIPVGAVVVHDGKIIGEGFNQSIMLNDPSSHAEMNAIRQAGKYLENYRLIDCTLYVTLEPCPMCAGALVHSRVERLVFSANDLKTGAAGSVFNLVNHQSLNHQISISSAIMKTECSQLLSNFFKRRRQEKKQTKQNAKKMSQDINLARTKVQTSSLSIEKNDFSQYQVLLVEDNRINQEVARHILLEFNIQPDIANNGLEAIEQLKHKKYDVILMDCQMPKMDGYQATKTIRKGQSCEINKDVIIIAMTANAMKGDRENCLAVGMTDYLSKPIEPEKINEKLSRYLTPKKVKMAINKTTAEVNTPEMITPLSLNSGENKNESDDKLSLWQQDAFNKRLNGNKDIQKKLITLFLESVPDQLDVLAASISAKDTKQQREVSHKLQGMSANLSAQELLYYTKEFNNYVKSPAAKENTINEHFKAIQSSFKALEPLLKEALS